MRIVNLIWRIILYFHNIIFFSYVPIKQTDLNSIFYSREIQMGILKNNLCLFSYRNRLEFPFQDEKNMLRII